MSKTITVWVVEAGSFENRIVVGVYPSIEAAIAANDIGTWNYEQGDDYECWFNDQSWEGARSAWPYEVELPEEGLS